MKRPELMAPAGSMAALRAALAAGADAVYLGGKLFNARQSAANFGDEELKSAIFLAHQAGAKVYVTVNTLLKTEEIPAAAKFLRQLYNFGADAAIVQDPGLIAVARETTPDLELHASTQLTIHNAAGVQAMEQLGIRRVVLARELRAEQIAAIRQETNLGLETFVHGALCIAYSGQCLFSSLTGGRSGNRGQCAQPCRLPYRLEGSRAAGHLLSPKDLCLYQQLPELLALGLDAWKIEGRLKRPAYVATVVGFYRQAIDRLLAGEQLPPWSEVEAELSQPFNRGFCSGYFLGKVGARLLSTDQPGHRGIVIGRMGPGGLIELQQKLQVGDVLQGVDGNEVRVNAILRGQDRLTLADPGRPVLVSGMSQTEGQEVRRLQSAQQEAEAAELVDTFAPRPMALRMTVRLAANSPLQLSAEAVGRQVVVTGARLPEPAINSAIDLPLLSRQLSKTGDSGFQLTDLQAEIEPGLSIPVSEINQCRRQTLALLAEEIWGQPQPLPTEFALPAPIECRLSNAATRLAVAVSDQSALEVVLSCGSLQRIYFGAAFHLYADPKQALAAYQEARKACNDRLISCYLRLPRILLPEEEASWFAALQARPVEGLLVSNWGGVWLARQLGVPFVLGAASNALNTHFFSAVPDAEGFYLSPELNRSEALAIQAEQGQRAYLEVHARHLLMVHEQCLLGANGQCLGRHQGCSRAQSAALVDRKGYRFPMKGDATCRGYLYNSQVCSLVDHVPELLHKHQGAEMLVDLELETLERIPEVLLCYLRAWQAESGVGLREQQLSLFPEGLTRGHWRRGV